jgi:hypothetical protein
MVGSCPNYLDPPSHMLWAYLSESDSLTLFGHQSAGDKLSCGSTGSLGKHAVAPKTEPQTGILDPKQLSSEPHADTEHERSRSWRTSLLCSGCARV